MEKTLQVLNGLEKEGVLSRYAIGGAMAAVFYVEPVLTFDLDVFVLLPEKSGLLTLGPLYETLRARGYREEKECVTIEGMPVQFLPAYNSLLVEALREAPDKTYGKTPTRVLKAEHLVAIALQTGRDKDRQRVRSLREAGCLDKPLLEEILKEARLGETMDRMDDIPPEIDRLLVAKERRRLTLATLPWPEKVRAIIKLQEAATPLLRQRDPRACVWHPT